MYPQHSPAEFVLTGAAGSKSLHPTLLQAATANSYVVYGVIPLVTLKITLVVVQGPELLDCTGRKVVLLLRRLML